MKTETKRLGTFFLIFILLSLVVQILIINQESFVHGSKILGVILMWIPGISAITALLIHKESLASIGWKLGAFKYYLISYLLPVFYYGIPFFICILFFGTVISTQNLPLNILLILSIAPLTNILGSLGEEIGWRGFLLPILYNKYSFSKVSLIIGIIWAVWHYPLIIFTDMYAGSSILMALLMFSIYTVSITYAYNWIWLKSRSIWTVSLLHGVNNSIALNMNTLVGEKGNLFELLIGDIGIIAPILTVFIAIGFLKLSKRVTFPANV